jgi:RNA polymerase sigma factor (sigma-70 family)
VTREKTLLTLLETHGPALDRVARFYAAAEGEEEDLRQEIVLQLWRSLPSFRGDSAAGTWLYRVALNTALRWRQRSLRQAQDTAGYRPRPLASEGGPRSEAAILAEFLGSLNRADRSILLLYMEALSHEQIAEVTGLTRGAVGVRLHRIKRTFEERYLEG